MRAARQNKEQHKKIKNNEMLGTAGARFEEELWQLKLEGQRLQEQFLQTKRLPVNAGNQRESCRRLVEFLNRELKDTKSEAERKTRECVALVDERECLAREPEIAEENNRKLQSRVKKGHPEEAGDYKGTKPIQSTTQSIRYAVRTARGNNHQNFERLQNVVFAVSLGQGWPGRPNQIPYQHKVHG